MILCNSSKGASSDSFMSRKITTSRQVTANNFFKRELTRKILLIYALQLIAKILGRGSLAKLPEDFNDTDVDDTNNTAELVILLKNSSLVSAPTDDFWNVSIPELNIDSNDTALDYKNLSTLAGHVFKEINRGKTVGNVTIPIVSQTMTSMQKTKSAQKTERTQKMKKIHKTKGTRKIPTQTNNNTAINALNVLPLVSSSCEYNIISVIFILLVDLLLVILIVFVIYITRVGFLRHTLHKERENSSFKQYLVKTFMSKEKYLDEREKNLKERSEKLRKRDELGNAVKNADSEKKGAVSSKDKSQQSNSSQSVVLVVTDGDVSKLYSKKE